MSVCLFISLDDFVFMLVYRLIRLCCFVYRPTQLYVYNLLIGLDEFVLLTGLPDYISVLVYRLTRHVLTRCYIGPQDHGFLWGFFCLFVCLFDYRHKSVCVCVCVCVWW